MYGFIQAARRGDFAEASEFLDLRRLPPEKGEAGPRLARQFKAVLDQTLWVDFSTLSDSNAGFDDDGLPAWQDRLGEIATDEGRVTLLLQRVPNQRQHEENSTVVAAEQSYPPASFQHFQHRLRFQCRACHEDLFVMKAGSSRMHEDEAHGAEGCGACHDGTVAFDAGLDDCARCHVPQSSMAGGS